MNIVLSHLPKNKTDIVNESICHCMHLVDIDYLRPSDNGDLVTGDIIPLNYTIKENCANSGRIVGHLSSLLFLEYPEYSIPVSSAAVLQSPVESSATYVNTKINDLGYKLVDIPKYSIALNLEKINEYLSIQNLVILIENNISKIQKMGLKDSFKWVGYVKMYKNLLSFIMKYNSERHAKSTNFFIAVDALRAATEKPATPNLDLSEYEKNNIRVLLKDLNILLLIVESDTKHREFIKTTAPIADGARQEKLVQKINNVELLLEDSDDGQWIKSYTKNFDVKMNGNQIFFKGENGYKMLDLYSKLSTVSKKNVFLNMNNDNSGDPEYKYSHTIEVECSKFAYVYSVMFPNGGVDSEGAVEELLKFSEEIDIPINLLLEDRGVSLTEYKDNTTNI
tara:strand:+ start:3452 stop:4633 length:1182 start_codon:yes stop_codon:yes gene_type:complete